MKYITTIDAQEYLIEIIDEKHLRKGEQVYEVDFNPVGDQPVYSLLLDGQSYEAYVYPDENGWQVMLLGRLHQATVEDEREKRLRAAAGGRVVERGDFNLKAPMPGLVVVIQVEDGQVVEEGEVLVILESMKMQNELRAPRKGTISRVRVRAGDSVEQYQTLLSVV